MSRVQVLFGAKKNVVEVARALVVFGRRVRKKPFASTILAEVALARKQSLASRLGEGFAAW